MFRLSTNEADLLETLAHLRYLASSQITSRWYPEKSPSAARRRLRTLRKFEVLKSVGFGNHPRRVAWRLGAKGFAALRDLRNFDFRWYKDVQSLFLTHLVRTNDIWLTLAPKDRSWRDSGFGWRGSHRAQLPFVSSDGRLRQRHVLTPDARIDTLARRVFIELDRTTEPIGHRNVRRTIMGKLEAYKAALVLPRPGARDTAYEHAFGDAVPPKLVFVLTKDPQGRRKRNILDAAAKLYPSLACVDLADRATLRALILHNAAAAGRRASEPPNLRPWTELYRATVERLRAARVSARRHPDLAKNQQAARATLQAKSARLDAEAACRAFVGGAVRTLESRGERAAAADLARQLAALRPSLSSPYGPSPATLKGDPHAAA